MAAKRQWRVLVPTLRLTSRYYSNRVATLQGDLREVDQSLTSYSHRFPRDHSINALIDRYRSLSTTGSTDAIKVGIYYKNSHIRNSNRVLESLLADPLALHSNEWFQAIANRDRDNPLTVKYGAFLSDDSGTTFQIPSSILSAQFRPQFPGITDKGTPPASIEIHQVTDLEAEWPLLHYILGVTDEPSGSMGHLSVSARNQIAVTIIDNQDYTPQSIETTPVTFDSKLRRGISIKINSIAAYEGSQKFYVGGTQAARDMIHMWRDSNVFELFKAVLWALDPKRLKQSTLVNILHEIQTKQIQQLQLLGRQKQFESHISEFGQLCHKELQLVVIPRTLEFFKKRLSWWRLYLKNDNVEYDLKDFFSRKFMTRSIEAYNFERGNLEMTESRPNPLLELKNGLITDRIRCEVQPVVTKVLAQGFVFYQLPLTLLGAAAYQWFDFSANSAIALALLGWTLGFNYVSRSWISFLKRWLERLHDQVRVCIDRDCLNKGLLKDFKLKHTQEWQDAEIRDKVACTIEKYTGNK